MQSIAISALVRRFAYRMVTNSLDAYGLKMDPTIEKYFNEFRKTHNQGVFDAYTSQMMSTFTTNI